MNPAMALGIHPAVFPSVGPLAISYVDYLTFSPFITVFKSYNKSALQSK